MIGDEEMDFVGSSEAAMRTGYNQSYIAKLCREGKMRNAEQDAPGKPWRIPVDSLNDWMRGEKN